MIEVMIFPMLIVIENDNENNNDKQWFFVRSDDVYWSFMPECGLWQLPRRECAQCNHHVHNTWWYAKFVDNDNIIYNNII